MLYFVSMGHWRNTAQKKVFCFLVPVCSLGLQVPAPMSGFSSINGFSNIWFLQCQQHLVASSLSWHFPQVHFLFYSFLQHPWAWIHRKFQGVLSEMPWQWLVCQSVRHSCALSNKVWILTWGGRIGVPGSFLGALSQPQVEYCSLYLLFLNSLELYFLLANPSFTLIPL